MKAKYVKIAFYILIDISLFIAYYSGYLIYCIICVGIYLLARLFRLRKYTYSLRKKNVFI